jgi:hypothetical protein
MYMRRTRGLFLLLAGTVAWIFPSSLRAQSFAMAPAEIDHAFKPGQPFSFQIAVSNDSDQNAALRVTVTDLWYDSKNEKTFDTPGTSPRSAANWMQAVPAVMSVPARGSQQIKIMVTPPADASGGYYATVFAESTPELVQSPTGEGKGVYANFRLGALVLLAAEGTQTYSAEVSDFKTTPPDATNNLKVEFSFHNTGNTHLFPKSTLAILNETHKLVGKAEAEVSRFFPGQTNTIRFTWPGQLAPGHYEGLLTIVYGKGRVLTQTTAIQVDK